MAGFRFEKLRLVPGGEAGPRAEAGIEHLPFAIEVTNASLQYNLAPFVRGSLKSNVLSIFGLREAKPRPLFVDAVRNLTLNIEVGERVALIGQNGSGKSTLLRALAGVYPLKTGKIRTVGRIGTLLDIGLGFEGEATGRENIFYRGMAMGYSRRQLREVEDEIVEFADLGEFIDLPVRTYSAGMYVRLGFAISTQISPDILLVDEVFGAGDAAFAQRAIERMRRIVEEAGIVVIATHDMGLVQQVCNRVVWLNRGEVMGDGAPGVIIPQYLRFMNEGEE